MKAEQNISSATPVPAEQSLDSRSSSFSNGRSAPSADVKSAASEFEQVKLLFDYTKFHIGLYTGLASALITLTNTVFGKELNLNPVFVWLAVIGISAAGLAGGVVASSLPHYKSLDAFMATPVGPYRSRLFKGEAWTYIEHTAFWVGIISILVAFATR